MPIWGLSTESDFASPPPATPRHAPPRPTSRAFKILEGDPVANLAQPPLILYNSQIGRVLWHANVPLSGKCCRNGVARMHTNQYVIRAIARAYAVSVARGRTRADDPDDPG